MMGMEKGLSVSRSFRWRKIKP